MLQHNNALDAESKNGARPDKFVSLFSCTRYEPSCLGILRSVSRNTRVFSSIAVTSKLAIVLCKLRKSCKSLP